MRRLAALACVLVLAAAVPAGAALPVDAGWLPGNAGVMWWQSGSMVPPRSNALFLTRRIAVSPADQTQHMGSFFHGLYASPNGLAWVNLTPACLLPAASPPGYEAIYDLSRQLALAIQGLDACGVEGIAYDPLLPGRMYVSAYGVDGISRGGANIDPGGVYVSDDRGLHWRKLLGGIRGNGLAVSRPVALAATIVAGYIQHNNGSVGSTPNGGSLSVSSDDGATWRHVVLPASGCSDLVVSSQRLTATVAVNPADPKLFYAGTNAGLYVSTNAGATWTLARKACGGVWGIAPSTNGQTLYIGDFEGKVWTGSKTGTGFTQLADLGSSRVQSLVLDELGRSLYASMWDQGSPNTFRINIDTGGTTTLGDSLLGPIDQAGLTRPFPLAPGNGSAPSLFLARVPGRLEISTVSRGTFWRAE